MTDCLDLVEVNREIKITEAKIKEIDATIEQLQEKHMNILKAWYIDCMTKDGICDKFHYASWKSMYDYRNRAIGNFSILYFGAVGLGAD